MTRRVRLALLAATIGCAALGLATGGAAQAPAKADQPRSGFDFMGPSTQAMQRDDTLNPGMLWVMEGEALWNRKAGKNNQSCAACHGDAKSSMRGVAARYPAFDAQLQRPVNLSQRINHCRQTKQLAEPLRAESQELLNIESYLAFQSRGMPTASPTDARLAPARERGQQLFQQRIGQLNLSCAQCHDDGWGKRLGSSVIPQGHANGYPLYRLEWQGLGSLQRRLRNCMTGVRAAPFAYGAQELVELELYLAARAKGLPLEAPAVRP
jgi:sulfur-oxidizing protein SoxA